MRKLLVLVISFFAISAQAATWGETTTSTNSLKNFVTKEVGGRSSVKFHEIQQSKNGKSQMYRVFAVVENTYKPEDGEAQTAISCDTIVVSKDKTGFQIVSWSKNDCDLEDIIFLKQQ